MQAYDVTQLVDLVTQPDGSIEIQPKQSDWDILSAADRLGWVDPGAVEPLPVTVERARQFLRATFSASGVQNER